MPLLTVTFSFYNAAAQPVLCPDLNERFNSIKCVYFHQVMVEAQKKKGCQWQLDPLFNRVTSVSGLLVSPNFPISIRKLFYFLPGRVHANVYVYIHGTLKKNA